MKQTKKVLSLIIAIAMVITSIYIAPVSTNAATTNSKVKVTNVKSNKKIMFVGSSFALKTNTKNVTYKSNKPKIVSVTESGVMYAKKKGKATITVKNSNGKKTKVKVTVKKAKRYSVNKKAGTYSGTINVKVKAKKGYKVYYTTSNKFNKKKVVKSGKKKTIKIKKTTTLSLYVVKKSAKISKKKMNKASQRKKYTYYVQYKYTINKNQSDVTENTVNNNTDNQNTTKTEEEIKTQDKINEATDEANKNNTSTETEIQKPSSIESDTPYVVITSEGISTGNLDEDAITYDGESVPKILTINKAGTYVLSGGTSDEPITNTQIVVAKKIEDEVNLIWDNLVIDNSALGFVEDQDGAVFSVGKSTTKVNITLKGQCSLTGNGSFTDEPAAVISADDTSTTLTFVAYEGDNTASLAVVDAMPVTTDYDGNDPSDGIYCKGTLILNSGTYNVIANGDCLKGTGKSGAGGLTINGGTYTLKSNASNALKSKNGMITINAGTINSVYTADDSINAKNYDVIIKGGNINIDKCYGDGIQGENVNISGNSTVVNIKTYFENAGKNYYNTSLGSGNYNTMTKTETSKTEVVNVDTGSHKGIKGGTKACTFSYKNVEDGSDYVVGTTYTQEASGGIIISGGKITVDTTNTGIKYNGGNSMGARPGQSSSSSGNLSAANNDGQYIIGAPEDAIHSNNTCIISGGDIDIYSADDGITGPEYVYFINSCDISIHQCYEGVEGGDIIIGSADSTTDVPNVKVYSNDDAINAASKSSVVYEYEDESEEKYTKKEMSASDNSLKILAGYLNVMIADDVTHSFSLPIEDGGTTSSTYSADGDGIDCNGSFYAYGGTTVVYGANSNDNSPIDTDGTYHIGKGATVLAVGSGMITSPTSTEQAVITNSSSGAMGGGMRPGQSSSGTSSSSAFAILDSSKIVILAIKPVKSYSYVLYSSPSISSGVTYTLYSGGSVSGSLINSDSEAHDYRYTGYNTSGATTSTVTAR